MPFGPASPEEAKPRIGRPMLARRGGDREDRLAPVGGIVDDAPADARAAELELRLDHRQDLAAGLDAGGDRGQDLGQRDERDVDRGQVGRERQVGGLEAAGVEALDHGHPRILSQTRSICP